MSTQHVTVTVNGVAREADISRCCSSTSSPTKPRATGTARQSTPATGCRASASTARAPSPARCWRGQQQIKTIEGIAKRPTPFHPLARSGTGAGLRCGFCTRGWIVPVGRLPRRTIGSPERGEIRVGISSNLCRCTGYVNIVKAICSRRPARSAAPGRTRRPAGASPARESTRSPPSAATPRTSAPRSVTWATRSSARKTRASSARPGHLHRRHQPAGPALARHRPPVRRTPPSRASTRPRRSSPRASSPSSPAPTSKAGLTWMPTLRRQQRCCRPTRSCTGQEPR